MRSFRAAGSKATVGVLAPSSSFVAERLERGLEILRQVGFTVKLHPQIYKKMGYLAGTDDDRLAALSDLLLDPDVDVIWAVRGGYGLHRIVDRVDFDLVRRAEKPIVGFSDLCALHSAILRRAQVMTVHGPVLTQLADLGSEDLEILLRVLSGKYAGLRYSGDGAVLHPGRAQGRLVGGCLSVIAPLVGSEFLFDLEGRESILLLEDVGEAPYRIDRLLTHLRLAQVFQRVRAVAVGDFVDCNSPRPGEQTIEEVLADRLSDLGIPVLTGLPFGHGKRNFAMPLGAMAELDTEQRCLTLLGEAE